MQEEISKIKKLVIKNNVAEALNSLHELVEADSKLEKFEDDVILLISTNSHLLDNEKENTKTSEYKGLVKDVLKILKKIRNVDNSSSFKKSETLGQNIKTITPSNKDEKVAKIAYLIPKPLDKKFEFDFSHLSQCFKSYEVSIDCFFLNLETLQNLNGYDYVFIQSEIFKGKIYIESEDLESQVISIEDLEDNIILDFKGLILIANGKLTQKATTLPFVHIQSDKNKVIKDFIFKCFGQKDLSKLNANNFVVHNLDSFEILSLNKGKPVVNIPQPNLPSGLDKKLLTTFLGRIEEQNRLIQKIKSLKYSGKQLTIKGAGGMGKTTLASKVAIELAYRNYFSDGVYFISCEYISSYKLFEAQIASCFEMDSITNFVEHIKKYDRFDKLILIDNFETLLNLDVKEERNEVRNLISLLTDYASIVITSREIIGFEFEEVIPLDKLPTDDALALFLQNSKLKKLSQEDEKILREDIIENLLNNNPLAIKIISSPQVLPSSKSMEVLRDELEKDFFSKTTTDFDSMFEEGVDSNIEKKYSLFHSIDYSYQKLRTSEKLAFELLHLFPDGIDMSHFRKFISSEKNEKLETKITDIDISSLENKSLVELSQGVIKLQSILARFARQKFNRRSEELKIKYYYDSYRYNVAIMSLARKIGRETKKRYDFVICNSNINNLLFALEYIPQLIEAKEERGEYFLNYIWHLESYILNDGAVKKFITHLQKLYSPFENFEHAHLFFDLTKIHLLYYQKTFDETFQELKEILPLKKILELNLDSTQDVDSHIEIMALNIYSCEGFTVEAVQYYNSKDIFESRIHYMLFKLGIYSAKRNNSGFYNFEWLINKGNINIKEIGSYIDGIYIQDHLDKMQVTYCLSKVKRIEFEDIDKLVITNPYTRGLKNLMFAFIEEDTDKKISFFENAIENLDHIKYYYIEGIYFYTKFLKTINHSDATVQFQKGYDLATKYQYRFLIHQFTNLQNDTDDIYNSDNYPLKLNFDIDEYVKRYNEERAKEDDESNSDKKSRPKDVQKKIKALPPPITNKPPTVPTLFVEGPTDKTAITEAIRLFKPSLLEKIEIRCERDERDFIEDKTNKGGGINWVKSRINGWLANKWKVKAAALFDADDDGIKAYNELKGNKNLSENKSASHNVDIYKLPNVYKLEHLVKLKELGIELPVALEEIFPLFCWEYASQKNWLVERTNISDKILKSKKHDVQHDGVQNFLSKNDLTDNLYLTKQIPMNHKQKFMNYITELSEEEKTVAFKGFEETIITIAKFFE